MILIAIYAPADTEKRPIVSKARRQTYKIISIIISISYMIISLSINNNFISNSLLLSLLLELIMINPLTYKIYKQPYNNYKTYLS